MLALALLVGLFRQGAYQQGIQVFVAALLSAAFVLALMAGRIRDVPWMPVAAGSLLAGWVVIDAAIHGSVWDSAGVVLLLGGMGVALLVCRGANESSREVLLYGLLGAGLLIALSGWLGVVLHSEPLAVVSQGLWRASSTLTYPNATAAVLTVLVLLVVARLTAEPHRPMLNVTAAGLLIGGAATGSRAGLLGLGIGLIVLALLQGPRRVARATLPPILGATIGLAGLLPSLPASATPRPYLAWGAVVAGLSVAAVLPRLPARIGGYGAAGLVAIGGTAGLIIAPSAFGRAVQAAVEARGNLSSPDRSEALRAAWRHIQSAPLTGSGPGQLRLGWTTPDGSHATIRFVHNEYVQVAAELGLVGAVLLIIFLVTLAWFLHQRRGSGPGALWAGVTAGVVALVIHASLDFLWHLPVIPLMAAGLVGLATATRLQGDACARTGQPESAMIDDPVELRDAA
jgi:hypothetical protein